jgi:hypothetical protein
VLQQYILLYWAVNNAGVMMLKILLKYLIMTLIIQELVRKTQGIVASKICSHRFADRQKGLEHSKKAGLFLM